MPEAGFHACKSGAEFIVESLWTMEGLRAEVLSQVAIRPSTALYSWTDALPPVPAKVVSAG